MNSSRSFHILLTDKNRHVRDLLQRELEREGYVVYKVESAGSTCSHILSGVPLDLIILDPELFRPRHLDLFREIVQGTPGIPVILHTYGDSVHVPKMLKNIHLIDKTGESIESIKKTILELHHNRPSHPPP